MGLRTRVACGSLDDRCTRGEGTPRSRRRLERYAVFEAERSLEAKKMNVVEPVRSRWQYDRIHGFVGRLQGLRLRNRWSQGTHTPAHGCADAVCQLDICTKRGRGFGRNKVGVRTRKPQAFFARS